MVDIHKLPFLLGGFMAVMVGIISYMSGSATQTIYIRMTVVLLVFYIVGSLIRNTVNTIKDEIKSKEEQKLRDEAAQMEADIAEASSEAPPRPQSAGHKLDLVADDFNEEFSPLTVSRIIASKVKE